VFEKVLISTLNNKFEIIINDRAEKAVKEAVTKATLQAKLEMVSFVLHLYEFLTTDLHPGQDCL
jgi:hypothetical protein